MEESACCAEVGISPGARPASARGCIWLLYEMRYIPDNSLQRAFSYCVLLFVSTGFAGNPVRCIAMFGWRVATHYPMLLGSRMRDEAGALNVAWSDVFG